MIYNVCSKCVKVGLLLLFLSTSGCSRKTELPAAHTSSVAQNADFDPQEPTTKKTPLSTVSNEKNDAVAEAKTTVNTDRVEAPFDTDQKNASNQTSQAAHGADKSSDGLSAAEAQQRAKKSLLNAKRLANQGEVAKAFQEILTSWQSLQEHSNDPSSQAMANELRLILQEYGESLNELAIKNSATTTSRKPLTVE